MESYSHKCYEFAKLKVFFKHTDYHGYVHPYNYMEWMSYAREAYFQDLVPNFLEVCNRNIKMVTAVNEFEFLNQAKFGDSIHVKIYSETVRRLSFDIVFEFYKNATNELIAKGRQRLTFLDGSSGRPAKIPEELRDVVLLYERKISSERTA